MYKIATNIYTNTHLRRPISSCKNNNELQQQQHLMPALNVNNKTSILRTIRYYFIIHGKECIRASTNGITFKMSYKLTNDIFNQIYFAVKISYFTRDLINFKQNPRTHPHHHP